MGNQGFDGGLTGTIGNGVRKTGDNAVADRLRARPVFGQRSNRAVILKNTLEPVMVPLVKRSVLFAPAPLSIER